MALILGTDQDHYDARRAGSEDVVRHMFKDAQARGDVSELKSQIDNIVGKRFGLINVENVSGVTKLSGYSFALDNSDPNAPKVYGSVNANYDSYYFYTGSDAALYFESVAPLSPTYIALVVGYNPSKTWQTDSQQNKRMVCSSTIRKRKIESNLPISSSSLDVSNAIVCITVNVNTTTSFYLNNLFKLTEDVALDDAQIDQVINAIPPEKGPIVQYVSISEWEIEKSNEQLNIYIPTVYGYVRYAFGHSIDQTINANSWRILAAIATGDNLVDRFAITTHGEWEMALKISGATDFIGGILHGDEIVQSIKFYVDGKDTALSDIASATSFKELRIVETTKLYDPDSQTDNVAIHNKEYIFTVNGLKLYQRILWLMPKTLTTSYCCMFPLIRGNDTVSELQITSDYYDDNDYQVYDVSVGGGSEYPFNWHKNVTRAHLYSDESGVFATARVISQPNLAGGNQSFLQSTVNQYNKLYFSICGIGVTCDVVANDRWNVETEYQITVTNNQ